MDLLDLADKSIFIDNILLSLYLGMCSSLAQSKKIEAATGRRKARSSAVISPGFRCGSNERRQVDRRLDPRRLAREQTAKAIANLVDEVVDCEHPGVGHHHLARPPWG